MENRIKENFCSEIDQVYSNYTTNQYKFLDDINKIFLLYEKSIEEEFEDEALEIDNVLKNKRNKITDLILNRAKNISENDPVFRKVSYFSPIDYGRLEVAFTRYLSWLLNPSCEHGLGDSVLTYFVKAIIPEAEKIVDVYVNSEEVAIGSRRKYGRLDIIVKATVDGRKSIILVEAKIDASLRENQLEDYELFCEDRYPDYSHYLVFLGPQSTFDREVSDISHTWQYFSFYSLVKGLRDIYSNAESSAGKDSLGLFITGIVRDILKIDIEYSSGEFKGNIYKLNKMI